RRPLRALRLAPVQRAPRLPGAARRRLAARGDGLPGPDVRADRRAGRLAHRPARPRFARPVLGQADRRPHEADRLVDATRNETAAAPALPTLTRIGDFLAAEGMLVAICGLYL